MGDHLVLDVWFLCWRWLVVVGAGLIGRVEKTEMSKQQDLFTFLCICFFYFDSIMGAKMCAPTEHG